MAVPGLISTLDVVNTMLATLGRTPVSTLTPPYTADVTLALQTLTEITRDVLSKGWYINTEYDYPLTADGSGLITVPDTIIRFDPPVEVRNDIVLRRPYLYDMTNHTNVFDVGYVIKGKAVLYLDFDALSEVMKKYIMLKAARIFEARAIGSQELLRTASEQEIMAKTDMLQEDAENGDYTIYDGAAQLALNRYPNGVIL